MMIGSQRDAEANSPRLRNGRIELKHAEDEAHVRNEHAETLRQQPDLEVIIDLIDADDRRLFGP
jgi:hypothetical protein